MTGAVHVNERRESDTLKHTRDGRKGQTRERLGVLKRNQREMVTERARNARNGGEWEGTGEN